MLEQADDNALALRAAGGDPGAFARLLERHYDTIHRMGLRLLGERAEAEDLAQDVSVSLASRIRSFRGDARFTTWLYRVVLNAARDRLRAGARRERLEAAHAERDALVRAGDAQRAAEAEWLREALAGLGPELRETAVLVLEEELSHAEAAEVLDIAEGTVSWRMAQLRRKLRTIAETGALPGEGLAG